MVKIKALLDACVLYPMTIRDLLLSFAEEELFKPFWSQQIQQEWKRNLILNRPDLDEARLDRTILAMNEYFPDAEVTLKDSQGLGEINLPDADDLHVLAAAIQCNAAYLVTSNLKDFPAEVLVKFGIEPIHPDDFCLLLVKQNQESGIKAFLKLLARLKNPPRSNIEVLETLRKTDLPKTASLLSELTRSLADS
uniref:PIN domain-containing protein n=1 Tax=Algoriphagus sp. TaxID=1872435 RepID=UPI00258F1ADB|nr:PIN domain-containing protein [Algoriphagus sp.]